MATLTKIITNSLRLLHPNGLPLNFKVLDIGAQVVYGSEADYLELLTFCQPSRLFSFSNKKHQELAYKWGNSKKEVWTQEVFTECGAIYESLDLTPEATIKADLNTVKLPEDRMGQFDLVMNFGTSEHVFNQWNCFELMHNAAKIGGAMFHVVPMCGYNFHCLYKYDPKFFILLADANKYEMVYGGFGGIEVDLPIDSRFATWANHNAVQDIEPRSHLLEIILEKRFPDPFQPPLDLVCTDMLSKRELHPAPDSIRKGMVGFQD